MTQLAVYASQASESRGRHITRTTSYDHMRSVFQRDRDRIIHSSAFRKMKYKTQVFIYHEG
ncbi:MAG: deoxyguanosinetriphosphate triphosphohydrolase, partial [Candidatus Puniceispirillales bacterium]